MRHLLFFNGIPRRSEDVAVSEEYGTRDAALERLQERELALLKRELRIAAPQFDAIGRLNFVKRGGVHAQCGELIIDLVGIFLRRLGFHSQQTEPEEYDPEPHVRV